MITFIEFFITLSDFKIGCFSLTALWTGMTRISFLASNKHRSLAIGNNFNVNVQP